MSFFLYSVSKMCNTKKNLPWYSVHHLDDGSKIVDRLEPDGELDFYSQILNQLWKTGKLNIGVKWNAYLIYSKFEH